MGVQKENQIDNLSGILYCYEKHIKKVNISVQAMTRGTTKIVYFQWLQYTVSAGMGIALLAANGQL